MNQHLYDKVAVTVAIALAHKGLDSRHNGRVVEKVTRDILEAVREELPPIIDLDGKWELDGATGVYVSLRDDEEHDGRQLTYLSRFANDQGYNAAIIKMHEDLYVPLPPARKDGMIEELSNKRFQDGNQSRTTRSGQE